jgi:hypothetical protein
MTAEAEADKQAVNSQTGGQTGQEVMVEEKESDVRQISLVSSRRVIW